ncbi:acyltransferase family protein [Serratia marcescens]|uniref:acyltransferase family protein n=1 Tax=Serratia marcescens TaxID=615 RepID=UPI0034D51210
MSKERNLSFDFLKGVLILLVIVGHLLPGSADVGLRGVIYYFHMPLFLGVTGYFVRRYFLDGGVISVLKKYQWRMIIPYFLAFIVYSVYSLYFSEKIGLNQLIGLFLYPYYHLWYIPAVIIFVLYTIVIYKNNFLLGFFLFFFVALSIVWYCYADTLENQYSWLRFIGDKRFYYYYSFFLLGFLAGDKHFNGNLLALFAIALAAGILGYYEPNGTLLDAASWFAFNAALLLLMISLCQRLMRKSEGFLVKMGQVSLPIYLWHVLPILLVGAVIDKDTLGFYLGVTAILFALVIIFIRLRGKSRFFDSFFYGERVNWPSTEK